MQTAAALSSSSDACSTASDALLRRLHDYVELRGDRWFGLNTSRAWDDAQLGPPLASLFADAPRLWEDGGECALGRDAQLEKREITVGADGSVVTAAGLVSPLLVPYFSTFFRSKTVDQRDELPIEVRMFAIEVHEIARSTGAFELEALVSRVMTPTFYPAPEILFTTSGPFLFYPRIRVIQGSTNSTEWVPAWDYLKGGRFDLLRQLHDTAAEKVGMSPTPDLLRLGLRTPPVCPSLPRLGLLTGAAVDALLARGLGATLRREWRRLAEEARELQ